MKTWRRLGEVRMACTQETTVSVVEQLVGRPFPAWALSSDNSTWGTSTTRGLSGGSVFFFFFFFLFVCFTRYLVFRIAVLPHRPGVVYYHLLLRRETRIPGVAPFSFRIGIWDLFVHRGQKSYTPTAFGKLWTTPGVRCMKHASS